jgi:prolyl 4-hydroxylase
MQVSLNHGHGIHQLQHRFTSTECAALIGQAEQIGFEPATISTLNGAELRQEVRNNDRIIFDNFEMALHIWRRVGPELPSVWIARSLAGLNERFRFYRYGSGQKFDWHYDGAFDRSNGEKSLITVLIYLGGDYTGGETTFDIDGKLIEVRGEQGDVVFFPHRLRHKGALVTGGTKYMLRTDAMYFPLVGVGKSNFPSLTKQIIL